jgi:hypothetical protein
MDWKIVQGHLLFFNHGILNRAHYVGEGSPLDAAKPPNGGVKSVPIGKRPEGTYAAVSKALASDASHPTNAQHSARHKKGMDAFFMSLYNLPIHSSIFIRCSRPANR